ncbi:BRCA1 C Terminus (BRCT) domain-containing protein [Toxoplasma gondii ARI]|uniref:BRCA1 C Terminus (BRCT) domain-containing protein n=1 Tax=Toxoplasma gondii ARI TaxID=1074872 RepID=A0A139XW31_TOXGO|nr:BRCA1 C Terminus (BRCT) domain-containing protein [Toxoplasma gondii ARI]
MDNFLSLCSASASASRHPGAERPDVVVVSSQDSSEDGLVPTRAAADSTASAGSANEQRTRKKEEEEEKRGREKMHAERAAKEDEESREEEAREHQKEGKEVESGAGETVKQFGEDGKPKEVVVEIVEIESQTSMASGAEGEEGLGEGRNSVEEADTVEGDAYLEGSKRKARALERLSPSRQSASFLCEGPHPKSLFPEPTILSPLTRRITVVSSPIFAPPPVPSSSASFSFSSSSSSSSFSSSPSPSSTSSFSSSSSSASLSSSRSSLPAARSSPFACEVQSPPFEKSPFASQALAVCPGKSPFAATPRCDERGRRRTSRPGREATRPVGDRQKRISASTSLDAFLASRRLSSSPPGTPQPRRHSPGRGTGSSVSTPSLRRVSTPATPATVVLSPLSTRRGDSGRSGRSSLDAAEFNEGKRTAHSSLLSFDKEEKGKRALAKSPVSAGRDARRKREGPRGRPDGKQQLLLPLLAEQRECRRERTNRRSSGFREVVSLLNDDEPWERGRPAETTPRGSPHTTGGAAAGTQGGRDTRLWSPTSAGHRGGEGEGPLMLWGRVESEGAEESPETGEGETERGQNEETHATNKSSGVASLEAPASFAQEGDGGRREEASQANSGTSSPSNQVINVVDEDEENDEEAEAQEAPGGVCTLEKEETEEGELFHSALENIEVEGRREGTNRQIGNAGGRLEGESFSRLSSHPRLESRGNDRSALFSESHAFPPSLSPPPSRLGRLAGSAQTVGSSERLKASSACTALSPGSPSSRRHGACSGSPRKEGARGRVRRPRFSRVRRRSLRALEDLWRENEVLQKVCGCSGEGKLLLSRVAGKVLVLGFLTAGQWAAAACATDGELRTFEKEPNPLAQAEGETSRQRSRERFRDAVEGESLAEAADAKDRNGRKQEKTGALDKSSVGRIDASVEPLASPTSSSASDVQWRAEFLRGFQRGLEEAQAFCVSRASLVQFQEAPSRMPPSLAFLSRAVYRRATRGAALALAAREAAQQMAAVEEQWTHTREGRRRGLAGGGQPLWGAEARTGAAAKNGEGEDEASDTRVGGENREETDEAKRVVKGRRRSFKAEAQKTSRAPNRRGKARKQDGFSEKKEAGEQGEEEEQDEEDEEDEQDEEEEERERLEWALSRELLAFLGGTETLGDPGSGEGGARIERSRHKTNSFQQSRSGEERMHLFHESAGCTTPEEAEGKTAEEREEGENHNGGKDHREEKESEAEEGRKRERRNEEPESPGEERARELLGLTKVLPPRVALSFNFSMFRFLSQSRVW